MEKMEELLKKYARAQTTPEETAEVRRYLSEHFDKVLQVIDEMRRDARQDLNLSDDTDDPVAELKAQLEQESGASGSMFNVMGVLPVDGPLAEVGLRQNVQQVLFDLLLGEDKEN